ncbi:hypothetical protein C8R46DRAFT_226472 [Mycena filopes]|nr:hypothetical protein C8R46DRAFT_226472 [Mycena filopes]
MPPRTIFRLCLALGLLSYGLAHPLHQEANAALNRGLGGLLGGAEDDPLPPSDPELDPPAQKHPHLTFVSTERLAGLFTTARNPNTATSTVPATIATGTATDSSRTTSTLASGSAFTPSPTATFISLSTNMPSPTITIGVTKQAPSTPPAEATEWKVIGIAVVSIALIAGVMLAFIYFDAVLALVGMKRKDRGTEDMIPDWAGRDWEFKIASEDGHRYPTLASLESITKSKQELAGPMSPLSANSRHMISPIPDLHSLVPTRPPSLYLPAVDPHPLEPLLRRPSASNRPVLHRLRA